LADALGLVLVFCRRCGVAVGLGAWGWVMRSLVSVLLLQWAWYRIASNKRKSPALWLGF
jgi:hypothetical protein